MSIRIDQEPQGGFRVRLSGDRARIVARSVNEVVMALKHYYAIGDVDRGCHGTTPDPTHCPVCRAMCQKR